MSISHGEGEDMDRLFGKNAKFWVDSIYDVGSEKTRARIIPDINSKYFPPWHTRVIEFPTYQLDQEFFRAKQRSDTELRQTQSDFTRGIIQGGYYDLGKTRGGPSKTRAGINTLVDVDLEEAKATSPVDDDIRAELQSPSILNQETKRGFDNCHLYCFNVGQGDSSLLVLNGNAYLIDTNIYAGKKLKSFIEQLHRILERERLGVQIKALIITHKHVDHLRGANRLLERGPFKFDHFIINHKYTHATGAVAGLLIAAKKHIPERGWVDASQPFKIHEGKYILDFLNPTYSTNTQTVAPDINDSSIVFAAQRESGWNNRFIMTGDASSHVLEGHFKTKPMQSFLSVSHHGSRTGTSDRFRKLVNPIKAHISAGKSKNYGHPHKETCDVLALSPKVPTVVSKEIRKTAMYDLDTMKCSLLM